MGYGIWDMGYGIWDIGTNRIVVSSFLPVHHDPAAIRLLPPGETVGVGLY
jgi:hypothetical protein